MARILLILVIYNLTVYSSCRKNSECANKSYTFSTTINATPDLDSININDTVWLEFTSPTTLTDVESGALIDFSNAINLSISINFFEFIGGSVSNPGVMAAANFFDYKLIYGVFVPDNALPDQNRDYRFVQINNEYKFKLGIIPKRVGIFTFSPSNSATVRRANDECSKAGFNITFANTNQHLYFYEQNRPGYIPSQYERTHMYCFKVK